MLLKSHRSIHYAGVCSQMGHPLIPRMWLPRLRRCFWTALSWRRLKTPHLWHHSYLSMTQSTCLVVSLHICLDLYKILHRYLAGLHPMWWTWCNVRLQTQNKLLIRSAFDLPDGRGLAYDRISGRFVGVVTVLIQSHLQSWWCVILSLGYFQLSDAHHSTWSSVASQMHSRNLRARKRVQQ